MSRTLDKALARRAEKIVLGADAQVSADISTSEGTRSVDSGAPIPSTEAHRASVVRRVGRAIVNGSTALASTLAFAATGGTVQFQGGMVAPDYPPSVNYPPVSAVYGAAILINPATTGTAPITYVKTSGPAWLAVDPATGQITGTAPGSDATDTLVITASNVAGSVSVNVPVSVTAAPVAPSISYTAIDVPAGTGVTVNVTATGTAPITYVKTSGPAWLAVDPATGQITGTAPGSAEASTLVITASNIAGSDTANVPVNVAAPGDFQFAINDFSRDLSIFDSASGQGLNVCNIPVSGTTDAPSGTVIEGRAHKFVPSYDGDGTGDMAAQHARLAERRFADYRQSCTKTAADLAALPGVSQSGDLITIDTSGIFAGYYLGNTRVRVIGSNTVVFLRCASHEQIEAYEDARIYAVACGWDGQGTQVDPGAGLLKLRQGGSGLLFAYSCFFTRQAGDAVNGAREVIDCTFDLPLPAPLSHVDMVVCQQSCWIEGNLFITDPAQGLEHNSAIDFVNSTVWLRAGTATVRGNAHYLDPAADNSAVKYSGELDPTASAFVIGDRVSYNGNGRVTQASNNIEVQDVTLMDGTPIDALAYGGPSGLAEDVTGFTLVTPASMFADRMINAGMPSDWVALGTSAGAGAFFGSLPHPRSPLWLEIEARVQGANDTSQQTTKCGVGLVVFHQDQSNTHQGLQVENDKVAQANGGVIETPVPNHYGDMQIYWRGNTGNNPPSDRVMIHHGNRQTNSLASMAETFARTHPGLKVMIGFDTLGGSAPNQPLWDDPSSDRDWAVSVVIANGLHADGAQVGVIWGQHYQTTDDASEWAAGAYFGLDLAAAPLPAPFTATGAFATTNLSGIPVNHIWPELYPEFTSGYSQWIRSKTKGIYPEDLAAPPEDLEFVPLSTIIPSQYHWLGTYHGLVQPTEGDSHWDGADIERGMPEKFRWYAINYLQCGGTLLPNAPPKIDHITWTENYIEMWSDAGPITTAARRKGLSTNFPVDPTASPLVPGDAEVLGFTDLLLSNYTSTEIVDDLGNPADAGRIRIYPNGGGTFGAADGCWYLADDAGYQRLPGLIREDYLAQNFADHYPIVDIGVPTVWGQTLQPLDDASAINDANDISLGEPAFTVTTGDVSPVVSATNFSGEDLTVAARMIVPGSFLISRETSSAAQWSFSITNGLAIDMSSFLSIDTRTADGVAVPGSDGFLSIVFKFRGLAGSERAELWVNGVEVPAAELSADQAFSGNLRNGRKHTIIGTNGTAQIAYIRQWQEVSFGDALEPSSAPWVEVRADPTGAFTAPSGGTYDIYDDGTPRTP